MEVWEGVAALLAEMDVLLGFAEVAVNAPAPYIRPQMLPPDEGELKLVGCRHPCVEAQEGVDFIKNDCCMTRGESWFQIITGPNMGGKSTYIRQVLALCDCFGYFRWCQVAGRRHFIDHQGILHLTNPVIIMP